MSKTAVLSLLLCALVAGCAARKRVEPGGELGMHGGKGPQATPPVTLSSLADDAILFDDLGSLHREVTTRSPQAQAYFDQGLRLLYAFNHDEATRSFARAAAIDPTCAMCWWGASVTLGPNYNVPMLPERSVMAWEALQKARAAAPQATPVEQDLIAALAKRYAGPEPLDPPAMQPYSEAYAAAMRGVAQKHPDDLDVQVLFAEALMDLNPWKLWSLDGQPAKDTPEIVRTLETVLAKDADHPGANHYYIHAIEASPHPEKGLPSADRLGPLMPGAGHTVHMPAHIYQRVGRYASASEANRKAIKADRAYIAKAKPWGYYPMYLSHNYGFLAFATSMEGRSAESVAAAHEAAKAFPPSMVTMMPGMDYFVAAHLLTMVRFGKWDEVLDEPRPNPRYPVFSALWLHAQGMAHAAKGRQTEARAHLAELEKILEDVSPEMVASNNLAKDVIDVAARVLEARITEKEGKPEALAMWADAVARADRLSYAEPADWFYPVRHYQGAALLAASKYREAEGVYREDLRRNPGNGWALFGLSQALLGQGKKEEAAKVGDQFAEAWANADIKLTTTAF